MTDSPPPFGIIFHGGAEESCRGNEQTEEVMHKFLGKLTTVARNGLESGCRAIDVVATITEHMENFTLFNAGKGAALNRAGYHEVWKTTLVPHYLQTNRMLPCIARGRYRRWFRIEISRRCRPTYHQESHSSGSSHALFRIPFRSCDFGRSTWR